MSVWNERISAPVAAVLLISPPISFGRRVSVDDDQERLARLDHIGRELGGVPSPVFPTECTASARTLWGGIPVHPWQGPAA
jgi:hypothetical protein